MRRLNHDMFECGCGCGQIILLDNWDVDGADRLQPDGFYDDSCQQWFTNACGDRKTRRCEGCQAFCIAVDMRDITTKIADALFHNDPAAALSNLRRLVAVEHGLGRRLRTLIAKKQKPAFSTESCDPTTCLECRVGAA